MKVLFIVPPQEFGYGYINDYFWQQGILYLSSFLKKKFDIEIDICDGNINSMKECESSIKKDYDFIAFHCVDHAKKGALHLAEFACEKGCKNIIFGGAGAIFGPEQYLVPFKGKYPDVKISCCLGAGEYTFEGFIQGKEMSEIPNLMYLDGDSLAMSKERKGRAKKEEYLEVLPFEVYKDITKYLQLQLERGDYPYNALTYSALSHEGCIHRVFKNGRLVKGCNFCSIPRNSYSPRNPETFWKEIGVFNEHCKKLVGKPLASIKDWGDSVNEGLLKNLVKARPKELEHIKYSCYLSISEINKTSLELLKELNCFSIYIGIDGTNELKLQKIDKQYSEEDIWERLELLKGYDFKLEIGILLGIEGETKESLKQSIEFMKKIKEMFNEKIIVLQGNVLVPYPGSLIYSRLAKKLPDDPIFLGVQKRTKEWIENFTDTTFEDCIDAQKEIEKLSPRRHSYICRSEK